MTNDSKPINWDIFNVPSIEQVHYYSILKKKREFSQLIKLCDAQVLKLGYLHYCSIVPKYDNSSLNDKCELFIFFFDDIPNTSFIGFRVKVSKETFAHESNLLLLFLKKSNKAIFYLMNNNCIHVKCRTSDAWEIFYLLYYEYLKRYLFTVIGTQFFYSFTYSYFIENEMQVLEMLYNGSKTVKISKKSIYYKIHKKRKISVSDLIYMIHNMPKTKKYAVSCFRFKKPPVSYLKHKSVKSQTSKEKQISGFSEENRNKNFQNTLLDNESNSTFERVCASSSSYQVYSEPLVYKDKSCKPIKKNQEFLHVTSKRKFQEIESDACDSVPTPTSKIFKSSQLDSTKGCNDPWKIFSEFKPLTIRSYSEIPCLKHVVSTLLKDRSEMFNNSSNIHLLINGNNVANQNNIFLPAIDEVKVNEDNCNHIISTTENVFSKQDIFTMQCTNETDKGSDKCRTEFLPSESESNKIPAENYFCLASSGDNFYSTIPIDDTAENINADYFDILGDVSFSTAAGKVISVSNAAMQTAHKIAKDVFSTNTEASNFNVHKRKAYNNSTESNSTLKKRKTEDIKPKISEVPSYLNIKCSEIKHISKEIGILSHNSENSNEDYFDSPEDVCFTTAAGKNINVSETAMLAAHKIIKDVFTEEKKPAVDETSNPGIFQNEKHKNLVNLKDMGCSSKRSVEEISDTDMDRTLVEKFFEDTSFDEKELELGQCNLNENSILGLQLNKDKNLIRKTRKSLGGRRSIRFSEKL